MFNNNKEKPEWLIDLEDSAKEIGAVVKVVEVFLDPNNKRIPVLRKSSFLGEIVEYVLSFFVSQKSKENVIKQTIILFNWPKGDGSYARAKEWSILNGLFATGHKEIYAISEQYPRFNKLFRLDSAYVVSTTGNDYYKLNICYGYKDKNIRHGVMKRFFKAPQITFGSKYSVFAFKKM